MSTAANEASRTAATRSRETLVALLDEAQRVATSINVPNAAHPRVAIVLLATVLKMGRSAAGAISRQDSIEASLFLRSLLEAFVDLSIVVVDPQHAERLELVVLDQRRRILRAALETGVPTPYLGLLAGNQEADAELTKVRAKMAEIRGRGVDLLPIRYRFARAGCLDLYEGPYSLLCDQAHNNLNALMERHFQETSDGPLFFVKGPPSEFMLGVVTSEVAALVALAVKRTKVLIDGCDPPEGLDNLEFTLLAVREALEQETKARTAAV